MAQLKDIKERINSVAKTKKMTQAMKMVAAAKFKRYSKTALDSRVMIEHIDHNINQVLSEENGNVDLDVMSTVNTTKKLVIVIAGDRGLCGGFNSSIFKFASAYINDTKDDCDLILFGKKANQYFKNKSVNIKKSI